MEYRWSERKIRNDLFICNEIFHASDSFVNYLVMYLML